MAVPTLRILLAELAKTNHAGRERRIALLAREHAGSPRLAKLLDGLTNTSTYHAQLALLAAKVSGDIPRLASLSAHSSYAIRTSAQLALPLEEISGEEFVQRYFDSPLATRRLLIGKAGRAKRTDLITALLTAPLADTDRAALLAHADPVTAAEFISDLGDLIPNLDAFAKTHPNVLLDELATRLDSPPQVRDRAWAWASRALARLAAAEPHRLLQLLRNYPASDGFPAVLDHSLAFLAKASPEALARLLINSTRTPASTGFSHRRGWQVRLTKSLRQQLRNFPVEDLKLLAKRYRSEEHYLASLLDSLPPSNRTEIFEAAFADVNTTNHTWSDALLDALPNQTRQSEIQRIAGLPQNRTVLAQVANAALMAPDLAAPILLPQLGATDATERSAAWRSLITSAGHSRNREALTNAIAKLDRLANEQDPVRCAVAEALNGVSPRLLAAGPIEPLQGLAESVAQSGDTSQATLSALQSVAWSLIEQASAGGTDIAKPLALLVTLSGRKEGISAVPATITIPARSVPVLVGALLPQMRARAKRNDYRLVFALWRALGKRAWVIPELNQLVESALTAPSDHWQSTAAEAWLAPPNSRGERVEALLKLDETFATLASVQRVLCRYRQDLVDVCFRPQPLKGRFWKKGRYLPILPGPFTGWLPGQLRDYADALDQLIASSTANDHDRARAVATFGRLPGVGTDRLQQHLSSPIASQQQAALGALAWTDDSGQLLEQLLSYRSSDLARVAMYSAGRCARHRDPAEAAALLAEVLADPEAKVTSRKEAVRLMGKLRTPGSLEALVRLGSGTGTHLDVRIASTRTLRHFLNDDQAWMALEDLAVAGRDSALSLIRTQPAQLAVRHRARFAQVLALAAAGADPEAIEALGAWTRWSPHLAEQISVLAASADLVTATAAIRAVSVSASSVADWTPFLTIVESLAGTAANSDQPNAEPDCDQPANQRISWLIEALCPNQVTNAGWYRQRLDLLATSLERFPDQATLAWTVRLAAINWSDPAAQLAALAEGVDPLRTAELSQLLNQALLAARQLGVEPQLAQAADLLAEQPNAPAAGLALALVADGGVHAGWTTPWRDRLRALRQHPVPAIAAWARNVYTVRC